MLLSAATLHEYLSNICRRDQGLLGLKGLKEAVAAMGWHHIFSMTPTPWGWSNLTFVHCTVNCFLFGSWLDFQTKWLHSQHLHFGIPCWSAHEVDQNLMLVQPSDYSLFLQFTVSCIMQFHIYATCVRFRAKVDCRGINIWSYCRYISSCARIRIRHESWRSCELPWFFWSKHTCIIR